MRFWHKFAIGIGTTALILSSLQFNDAIAGGPSSGGSHSSGSHSSGSTSKSSGSSSKPSSNGGYTKPSSSGSSGGHSTIPSSNGSHNTPTTPSNSGYSKPSTPNIPITTHSQPNTPTATHNQPSTPSQGYSKPSTPSTTNDTHSTPKPVNQPVTPLGAASNKKISADSYKAYQAERNNASKPPQPVHATDVKNNPARATYQNTDQYMNKRTTIINNYNNTHPGWGSMGQGMSPNYGMWSNSFLTGMIMGYVGTSLLSNSMWMYSHMREPWYPSYRADLETQAANNAELKSKLAAMDVEIEKLRVQNAHPLQTNTLPENVDPALAIAPEIMMAPEEHSDGMSWWYAPFFFTIGLGAAFLTVKLFK